MLEAADAGTGDDAAGPATVQCAAHRRRPLCSGYGAAVLNANNCLQPCLGQRSRTVQEDTQKASDEIP